MSRMRRVALCAVFVFALIAAPAAAHSGSPKYLSVYNGLKPAIPGVKAQVLGFDNQYQLINQTGKTVLIYGYQHEPYGRMLPDGTVEVNQRSPAYWLNQDRAGTTTVPASANPKAPPLWKVQDKASRFTWHDHRMHWMGTATPKQVSDQHKKTKIFDYAIPISVGGKPARLTGTLFWRGTPKGAPTAAIAALVAVVLAAIAFVVLVRRRRRRGEDEPAPAQRDGMRPERPKAEAW
jgi:hypothetical protein